MLTVSPPPAAVEIAQNRNREKTFFKEHNLPVNSTIRITSADQIHSAFKEMGGKVILKTAQFGYDGKGQQVCSGVVEVESAFEEFGGVECVLEDFVPFDREVSVVLARDQKGRVETFPLVENQHRDGILDISIVPARVSETIASKANTAACSLANALNYVGVLAVEMFVCGEDVYLNEIAPRPHNSGHFSMDACNYSQFDQQVRTLVGLPVAKPVLHKPAVMFNLLGDQLLADSFIWSQLQQMPNAHVHVYGKSESRAGRKMGHINLLGDDVSTLLMQVEQIRV